MTQETCKVSECPKEILARGMCPAHYHRWRRANPHLLGKNMKNARRKPAGTKTVTKEGYVMVKLKKGDPMYAMSNAGWVSEHRLVIARSLGRPLLPTENVHHKDGVRNNNTKGNLELWVVQQPFGQRYEEITHCPGCNCPTL